MTRGPTTDGETDLARRRQVDAFVQRHFTWRGTLRLHRAALGADILRAPVNVLLSPAHVTVRLTGWICRGLRLRRTADFLLRRQILLRTAVSARVEAAILTELLAAPPAEGEALGDRTALARAILSAPRFREAARSRGSIAAAQAMADRIAAAITEYSGARSAMAEFTTALMTLVAGAIVLQAVTPGMISMAAGVAESVSLKRAVADFPLGQTLGGVWYGIFPAGLSPRLVAAVAAGLMLLGSVITAFAGAFADVVQAWLGMHRRRLLRLLDTVEAETAASPGKPFAASEHLLARVFDLSDAALSLLRIFRG
ncbi:hypothetical protein OEZ60_11355 [Defluviimonas sp. WL0024]|uniref:Uncharacterized protein n=2 Tax=Albidovulum TaxID=205889 RepID=A0ABT3IY97_9RHOB|nr:MULTISPECIES: DUF6635 family protein [Defluviimonas]MCU9848608.1 hypothetical protein [Defluviimonas sp. WL0024]MCW3780410.1 hypothetical protein [Defluviimonas salinarum]